MYAIIAEQKQSGKIPYTINSIIPSCYESYILTYDFKEKIDTERRDEYRKFIGNGSFKSLIVGTIGEPGAIAESSKSISISSVANLL